MPGKNNELHKSEVYSDILNLPKDHLVNIVGHKPKSESEMSLTFKHLNAFVRNKYSKFIEDVGKSIFPLIIATDHDEAHGSGIGTTFVLYQKDGSELKISPALHSNYAVYKAACHTYLGIGIQILPYLKNNKSNEWIASLCDYKAYISAAIESVNRYSNTEKLDKERVTQILQNALAFITELVERKQFTLKDYEDLCAENFSNIKTLMTSATEIQAEANLKAMLSWKEMIGETDWDDLYVVIPTVYPVSLHNPRLELFRNIMTDSKQHTHIILSDWPRGLSECRNLLGRVVGDQAIGRLTFGVDTPEQRMKTVALSTGVDVVSDDAVEGLWKVMRDMGLEPKPLIDQWKAAHPQNDGQNICPFANKENN